MAKRTNQEATRARVFISCGQNKDEAATADAIGQKLDDLGFKAFVAKKQQTLKGIKENVFEELDNSEYFIFVDFKRHRGSSLFSHQELALASYLEIDALIFREVGVRREGLLRFVGGNAFTFKDRKKLPDQIADEVRKRRDNGEWKWDWRNEIVLEREPTQWADVESQIPGLYRRFFHVVVRNRHRRRAATNCYVYLEKATRCDILTEVPLQSFELKWEGFLLPYVNIPPGNQFRRFDAFCIPHDSPDRLDFSRMFTDWIEIVPRIQGAGRYKLTYLVLSSNFAPARGSFILNLAPQLNSTTLT